MGTAPLRVVLRMEPSLLSSAIAQVLAGDPRLAVEILPPGEPIDAPGGLGTWHLVEVAVLEDPALEDPPRIELHAGGRDWVLEYRGLECLAVLLVDCQRFDAAQAVRAHGG